MFLKSQWISEARLKFESKLHGEIFFLEVTDLVSCFKQSFRLNSQGHTILFLFARRRLGSSEKSSSDPVFTTADFFI